MTRAALLPFCGDPFLLKTWLSCFEKWQDEIDVIYIIVNCVISPENKKYIESLLDPLVKKNKCVYLFFDKNLDHGPALDKALSICTKDLIMLVEEDGFIFKPNMVSQCFKFLEDGKADIIASPRGSCSREIYEKAEKVWGTPAQTPNFWPNFFFISRENLLKTDRHFHAKAWYKNDYIKELDLTITDDISPADTFVWASIQLRGMGLRVELMDQYHSRIEDIQDRDQIKGIFDRKCPWIHIGSLSGWQNVLFSPILQFRIGEVEEWERRAGAWLMFWEDAQNDLPENMKEFSREYKAGIDRLITEYTLSPARVKLRAELFRSLINPELHAKRQKEANKV